MFILGASQCGGNGHFKTDASVVYIYIYTYYLSVGLGQKGLIWL